MAKGALSWAQLPKKNNKRSVRNILAHPINQGENSLILYKICTFAP